MTLWFKCLLSLTAAAAAAALREAVVNSIITRFHQFYVIFIKITSPFPDAAGVIHICTCMLFLQQSGHLHAVRQMSFERREKVNKNIHIQGKVTNWSSVNGLGI